jgi:sigma-B regulation protein RsbU (phosphoserine phosphatase)
VSQLSDIKKELSIRDELERKLHLKQLQINRLLNITQAINENVKAEGLFNMYNSFLSWEMGVKKMALFYKKNNQWLCATSLGINEALLEHDISDRFAHYKSMKSLDELDHPLVGEFEIVIPVFHKETPIAFTFLGGFDKDDDLYNKVQFITAITNIVAVAIENKRLVKRQIQQERLTREIELASDMQRTLVPAALPNSEAYELSSIYIPHLEVGGDYFDCIEFDHKLCFCVADISGKGLAAALLMANFQANLRALVNRYDDLKCFIRDLNQAVLRITNGDKFVTFFYAEFCTDTRILRYINAGHIPPYLATKGEIQYLNKGCTILGIFDQITDLEIGELHLDEEAFIFTFTDGITDIRNHEEEFYGDDRLLDFFRNNYHLKAKAFNTRLLEELKNYKEKAAFPDDLTVLSCRLF